MHSIIFCTDSQRGFGMYLESAASVPHIGRKKTETRSTHEGLQCLLILFDKGIELLIVIL